MATATLTTETALSRLRLYEFEQSNTLRSEPLPRQPFRDFLTAAWPVIEPKPFVSGYHVDAICEHLQAVSDGDLKNLIINMPPRHGKSTLVSVLWPAWVWTQRPWLRWLFASYALNLSVRDSVRCRRLIQSEWYQRLYSSGFKLTDDQNLKTYFENDKGGVRFATSVGATTTGTGGDCLVIDDPLNALEAASDAKIEEAIDWFDGSLSTRGDDPAETSKVIVMQRLHQRDLTGHVLELMQQEGEAYDLLVLPAEYEPTVQVCLSERPLEHDPRVIPGEPLWPARWSQDRLNVLKVSLGDRASGQLQQRPSPAGGAIFQRKWWDRRNRYDPEDRGLVNRAIARWLILDTAMKDKESNDYTACSEVDLLPNYQILWRKVWWERLLFPDLLTAIEDSATRANRDEKLRGVIIEDKGSGTSALQSLRAAAPPWLARLLTEFQPSGSKEYRARQASLWCARDCILLPNPSESVPWLFEFEETLFAFPNAAHDDVVDTVSSGIIYLEHYIQRGFEARGGQVMDKEALAAA